MSLGTIKVGLVQMAMDEDRTANLDRAITLLQRAADEGANVVCLPELFCCRYFCQSEDSRFFSLAEPIPGPTTAALEEVTRARGITVIASLFERRAPGLYHNSAAVIDGNAGYIGMYRKMHIPDDPAYYEKFYFTPGDLGFRRFDTSAGPIGVLVCWDQWYPEAARLTAMTGAAILFYPTAIGWHPHEKETHGTEQQAAWETIQRSHAIANGCYVVAVNRFGFEPAPRGETGIEFWGSSFIVAPDGQVVARAGEQEEAVIVTTLDLAAIETQRQGWPFFRDRRIDAYDGLLSRYRDD